MALTVATAHVAAPTADACGYAHVAVDTAHVAAATAHVAAATAHVAAAMTRGCASVRGSGPCRYGVPPRLTYLTWRLLHPRLWRRSCSCGSGSRPCGGCAYGPRSRSYVPGGCGDGSGCCGDGRMALAPARLRLPTPGPQLMPVALEPRRLWLRLPAVPAAVPGLWRSEFATPRIAVRTTVPTEHGYSCERDNN